MGRATVRPLIWKYLTDRPGEEIHIGTMQSDLGLSRGQVQHGMRYLVDKNLVDQVIQGNAWRYTGRPYNSPEADEAELEFHYEGDPLPGETVKVQAAEPIRSGQLVQYVQDTGDLMEIIKCLKNGKILLQDSEGVLYVASKLEV